MMVVGFYSFVPYQDSFDSLLAKPVKSTPIKIESSAPAPEEEVKH